MALANKITWESDEAFDDLRLLFDPPEAVDLQAYCKSCGARWKSFTFHLASPKEIADDVVVWLTIDPHALRFPYAPNTWQCIDCWLGENEDWIDITTGEWDLDFDEDDTDEV